MTTVQPVATTAAAAAAAAEAEYLLSQAAVEGSKVSRRKERERGREREKGFTDTDQAWLPKRQHHALDPLCCSLSAK